MIIDKLMQVAHKASLAVAAGTRLFGSVLDMQVARNNGLLSATQQPGFLITFTTAMAGAGASVQFALVTDAAANLATPTVLATSEVVATADGVVGKQLFIPLPDTDSYEQYLGFQQITTGATITAGAVSIEFTAGKRNWRAYPTSHYS